MNGPDQREEAIFQAALKLPSRERATYLDQACGTDKRLRQRIVERLFKAGQTTGDARETPPASPPAGTMVVPLAPEPAGEKPGDRIGDYKLLEQIGEGGCGVVYLAEQTEPIRRRVAFKVIKLGMDTKLVVARFEGERQALALMDHPSIAKVLDAGATDTGRPYFVMELVKGIKITDFCDQNHLDTNERLELFIQVCHAVQHAHQKGIIHRDLKPSNILVSLHDGVPVPKVIDFGIAKATQQPLTDKTLFTSFEQFIGTPAYMSPEQADLSGLDIDTRSDIYALGVLLYELLTGRLPFEQKDLVRVGVEQMRRVIREQEPPRPSTLLSTLAAADLSAVAKQRHAEPPRLISLVRGDLDWIVMKCLEKDRARRYPTADALADDLGHHLKNEPVEARPPSRWYRFQKLVHRNKLVFAAAGAVVAALMIGLAVSTWLVFRERAARRLAVAAEAKARTEANKSQQVAGFLGAMLHGVGPSVALGRGTTLLREILDNTAKRVGSDLTNQPEVEPELRATIGTTYLELGDLDQAEAMEREALRLRRTVLGETNALVATSLYHVARVLARRGRSHDLSEAEATLRQALAMRQKLLGANHPDTAASVALLAGTLTREGKLAEAETFSREALAIRRKLRGNEHQEVASSLDNLAIILRD